VGHGAVRVRLDVADVQAGMLLRAAGARRFAWNWAVAKIKANADQWQAEGTYGIDRTDRVRPLTFFTLAKQWTAEKPGVAPWTGDHSTWTFRYALRDAANAHAAFLAGKRRFPRFKSRHRDRARFTVRDGLQLKADRDANAAANLAAWGEHTLRVCPCVSQAGDRHLGGPTAEPVRHACGGWVSAAASQAAAVPPGEAGTSRPRTRVA
jgi:hypothetical protein